MQVQTVCDNCIFAQIGKNYIGGEPPYQEAQNGCYFDRIKKFMDAGIRVTLDHKYYTIGAKCNRCFQGDGSLPIEEYARLAEERSRLQFDFIFSPQTIEGARNVAGCLSSLNPRPNKLLFVDRKYLNRKEMYDAISPFGLKWMIIGGPDATVDDAIDRCDSEYFCVLDDKTEFPPYDILQKIDDVWNEKMIQFFCIYGKYGTMVNYDMYKMFVAKWEDVVNKFQTIDERYQLKTGKRTYTWEEVL